MNILIVEDDLLIAEMLKEMLEELKYKVCAIKSTYEEVMMYLNSNNQPNLIFLDINLEQNKSGIDIGIELNKTFKLPFIYLTSYSDPKTIQNASKTSPEAYLTKPFNETQLLSTLEVVKHKIEVKLKTVTIKDGSKLVKLLVSEICYIKSDSNYLEIYTKEKRYVIRGSFVSLLNDISSLQLVRVHRSYAVNTACIDSVSYQDININQTIIPLSRNYRAKLMEVYQK